MAEKTRMIQVVPGRACATDNQIIYRKDPYEFGKALYMLSELQMSHKITKAIRKAGAMLRGMAMANRKFKTVVYKLRGEPVVYYERAREVFTPNFLAALLFVMAYRNRTTGELFMDEKESSEPEKVNVSDYFDKAE